ncbi:FecR domain-containing protein [Dyadobacter sp. CY312]|uniref:FecR family protein n=1 Tax=Dyadobacter sp. CY312 TaxID=2907303 RepID=UPI001F1BE713|nr:FecR domain-containing protein [Dyadobacter sp. CY312]MCE7043856.1 FecR domain-containing protein [Dyadobacter sp. CY312]
MDDIVLAYLTEFPPHYILNEPQNTAAAYETDDIEMKTSISKYMLFEYLSGRSNPLEKQLVMDWIAKQENSETFYEWLLEYEMRFPQFVPDQEKAIATVLEKVNANAEHNGDYIETAGMLYLHRTTDSIRRMLFIAASVLFIVSAGWWFRDPILYKTYQTGYGQTTDIFLEDGSKVALNANSSLKIPRFGFSSEAREVYLSGEGEFTVSHTVDHKRFIVKTSEKFQVEVLGTQFSVFARPRGTKVALSSGSVRLDYDENDTRKEVMMEPGDLAVLGKKGEVKLEKNQDTKTFALWKEQRYVFDGTSMHDIASMVEENFGIRVNIADEETRLRTITGNFKTKNAEELLKTISEALDLKMSAAGDSILLSAN